MNASGHVSTDPAESDAPRREIVLGGLAGLAFLVIFGLWAGLAPLDAGAIANGQIMISGNRQAVQHRDGGVVAHIRVSEGDRVAQGQVLIELSNTDLAANERSMAGQWVALLALRARLLAERDGATSIPAPTEFTTLAPEDRKLADAALALQIKQFQARLAGRQTETGVLQQRVGQLNQQITGLEGQVSSIREQKRLIGEELDGLRHLAAQGYAPQNRVRALERTAAALDGDLGTNRADIARAREAIGEAQLQILGVSTQASEEIADALRQTEVQINEATPRLQALRADLDQTRIKAPVSGVVVGLTTFTDGGVIAAGQTLMEIVPDKAVQVIVASVAPEDIDAVRSGQTTEIRFPGLGGRSTPLLHGIVSRVSADSFTDENTGRSHYRVEVTLPPTETAKLGDRASVLRPGMPAQMVIILRKRTALDFLLRPLIQSLWRAGSQE